MNIIKDKITNNYNFQGYMISYFDELIYFKMKNISYIQKQFINQNLNEFLSEDDKLIELINFLVEINSEDLNKIISNQETTEKFFDIIFKETNINFSFFDLLKEKLNNLKKIKDSLFNIFLRYLIENNYTLLQLKNISDLEIIELSLTTALIKNDEGFFELLKLITLKEDKTSIDKELTDLINEFVSKNKNIKTNNKSAFDQLSEL